MGGTQPVQTAQYLDNESFANEPRVIASESPQTFSSIIFFSLILICLFSPFARAAVYSSKLLYPINARYNYPSLGSYPQTTSGAQTIGYDDDAAIWSTNGETSLNPTVLQNVNSSFGTGTDGTDQVGYANIVIYQPAEEAIPHALLWSGTAASAVDLNPINLTQFQGSEAFGVSGNQQVGCGLEPSGNKHALLWTGSATSAIDLNPTDLPGLENSCAIGINGTQQVGYGYGSATGTNSDMTSGYNNHALMWSGTAASAIDLNPTNLSGYIGSIANAACGNQVVGSGSGPATGAGTEFNSGGYNQHAMLWSDTADSAVDLNPNDLSGINFSVAEDTNGVVQVGYGTNGTNGYALMWSGTSASAVNLQLSLPNSYTWQTSMAFTVDSSGNIYGVASSTKGEYAVEWSPVPEPTTFLLASLLASLFLTRIHRCYRV